MDFVDEDAREIEMREIVYARPGGVCSRNHDIQAPSLEPLQDTLRLLLPWLVDIGRKVRPGRNLSCPVVYYTGRDDNQGGRSQIGRLLEYRCIRPLDELHSAVFLPFCAVVMHNARKKRYDLDRLA